MRFREGITYILRTRTDTDGMERRHALPLEAAMGEIRKARPRLWGRQLLHVAGELILGHAVETNHGRYRRLLECEVGRLRREQEEREGVQRERLSAVAPAGDHPGEPAAAAQGAGGAAVGAGPGGGTGALPGAEALVEGAGAGGTPGTER